jgi:adenosylmethionine-8-amino-7-oxononanoate aminotransferase
MVAQHSPKELVDLAHKQLWIYFSKLHKSGELAIIERGEGSYVFDNTGKHSAKPGTG